MKKDIENLSDVTKLVDTFYSRVQKDDLIGPIFNAKLNGRWDEHLQKMYKFWQTVLLQEYTYQGRPFPPHASLDVDTEHFERWIFLFHQTVDEFFQGKVADEAKWRGSQMAKMFLSKIQYFKDAGSNPLT